MFLQEEGNLDTETHRGEAAGAWRQAGVMLSQAKAPADTAGASGGSMALPHLDVGWLASGAEGQWISVVFGRPVCGDSTTTVPGC